LKIEKILNNNAAVILNKKGQEVVVMGRGIAFRKKVGDIIDRTAVNKVFTLNGNEMNDRFQEMLRDMPLEHMLASEKIISMAKNTLRAHLNNNIFITLSDHISTAIDRYEQDIPLHNPMLWDIKQFYPNEYALGEKALSIIKDECGTQLTEDEAGFIALHFVDAQLGENMTNINQITQLIHEIINIVKYHFKLNLPPDSLAYFRFINHLKFFAQRMFGKRDYDEEDSSHLSVMIKQQEEAYNCALLVTNFIHKKYDYRLSDTEMIYMIVHIARIVKEDRNKKKGKQK